MKASMTKLLTTGIATLALAGAFALLGPGNAQAAPIPKELLPLPRCSQCAPEIRTATQVCFLVACGDPCQYKCVAIDNG